MRSGRVSALNFGLRQYAARDQPTDEGGQDRPEVGEDLSDVVAARNRSTRPRRWAG